MLLTIAPRLDLKREFNSVSADGDLHDDLLRSMRRHNGRVQDWNWVLRSRVVVVLNEAGAGKTAELVDQAARMPNDRPGFFLRIERLCTRNFASAFESEAEHRRFQQWRRSRREAVFFLDSVDEAKLPRDLDRNPLSLAIQTVEQALSGQIHRTRFVISSRPSAWTPELELTEVRRLAAVYAKRAVSAEGDAPLEHFVTLAPLDNRQRQQLAGWAQAPSDFLDALYRAAAADFASTPLDLLELVKAYSAEREAGRNGVAVFESLSTMTDQAISRRIAETGSDQPRNRLPASRTRLGARRIAAACVLAQQLAISLPGSSGQGIDPAAALDGAGDPWSRTEIDQLLACGLFTAAWEGSVRFHHRRTMERLAAEAFNDLLLAGMALDHLAALLTPRAFGVSTVPAPYASTLGWLASLNATFRLHILAQQPQLLLDEGDPGSHPANIREQALRRHAARYLPGQWRNEWFDVGMLRRFADPLLVDVCRELALTGPSEEVRRLVLDLIEVADFKAAIPEVSAIASSTSEPVNLRARALEVIAGLGTMGDLKAQRRAIINFRPAPSPDRFTRQRNNALRLQAVSILRPDALSLADALGVLSRLERRDRNFISGRDVDLAAALVDHTAADHLEWLLRWLDRLCWTSKPRLFGSYDLPQWTEAGWRLLPALSETVARIIRERSDLHDAPLLIASLEKVLAAREISLGPLHRDENAKPDTLLAAIQAAPRVREAIFFTASAIPSGRRADEPGFTLERLSRRHGFFRHDALAPADLEWMAAAYATTTTDRDRKALVHGAVYWMHALDARARRRWIARFRGLARARGFAEDDKAFREARDQPVRRLRAQAQRIWRKQRLLRLPHERQRLFELLQRRARVALNRHRIKRGQDFRLLWDTGYGNTVPDAPIAEVVKTHGRGVSEDFIRGVKAYAIGHDPQPPRGAWSAETHVAALGWSQLALDDPGAMLALDHQGARRALLAAIATDFPPWAAELAAREIALFQDLIAPKIDAELKWRRSDHRYAPMLSLVARQAEDVRRPFAGRVFAGLADGTPDLGVITTASAIIRTDASEDARLGHLGLRRFREHLAEGQSEPAAAWFAVALEADVAMAWQAFKDHDRAYGPASDPLLSAVLEHMGEGVPLANAPAATLAELAVDYMRFFPPEDDDNADGERTRRHDAETQRGRIPGLIGQQTTETARAVLEGLAAHPAFATHQSWMRRVLDDQAKAAATPAALGPSATADLMATFLKRPASAAEFRLLIERHIEAIADDLATSEFDRRGLLREALEQDVRALFGEALQSRAHGWYSVTQETVTAGEKRTDLRIEGRTYAGEIVIVEIKVAGPSWDGDQLVDHIEIQLVDQYLISRRVRHGIYMVVDLGLRGSWTMKDGTVEDFDGLVRLMKASVPALLARPTVDAITILPIKIAVPKRKKRTPRKII